MMHLAVMACCDVGAMNYVQGAEGAGLLGPLREEPEAHHAAQACKDAQAAGRQAECSQVRPWPCQPLARVSIE